jgi:hypothetical protein
VAWEAHFDILQGEALRVDMRPIVGQRVGNGFSPFPPFYKRGKNVSFGNASVRVLAYAHQEEFGEACEIFESESAFTK